MELLRAQVRESSPHKEGSIEFRCGDANEELLKIARMDWRGNRAVAFLDPFALHLRWQTIEAIARTKAIDMWLLFPAMAVNRMLPRSGKVPDEWAAKLTTTFGDDSWTTTFYHKEEPDLFGEETIRKTSTFFEKLSDYVTARLKTVFSGVNKKPLLLTNSTRSPLFLLCFASGNPRGAPIAVSIAQHIINKKSHGH